MKKFASVFLLITAIITESLVYAQYVPHNLDSYSGDDTVTFIVEMEGEPVLSRIQPLNGDADSDRTLEAQKYRSALLRSQQTAAASIGTELSEDIQPEYTYTELFNGFAIEAKYDDMESIRSADGVKAVYVSSKRKLNLRMRNASAMTHSLSPETSGYTGSGQVIAVLDSEFDVKHIAFSQEPSNPKYTKSDIADILSDGTVNASTDANRVYESAKIPFRYDYGDDDADTYSASYIHGTHVAGIAAGNSPDSDGFRGVAPDAQLALMKIADSYGYTSDASIVAAMDDAAKLGVCAINCSFGFDYIAQDAFNPAVTAAYTNAYNSGIFVSVAAGNLSRGFFGTSGVTADIDDSATGMPNALASVTSVASVDNSLLYFDVSQLMLEDGTVLDAGQMYANGGFESLISDSGTEYVYCGLGYADDFSDKDMSGKIAVVDRGTLTFAQKSDNAKAAGAVGIIIINNEDGYFTSSTLSLPAVTVKSSLGSLLTGAEIKKIVSMTDFAPKGEENDALIENYSSYGVTEELGLKPDISAPGGNIFSPKPGDKYDTLSGTSMSAPHISGIAAILSQYLEDTGCALEGAERADLIQNMLMSTAEVVYGKAETGEASVPYSPRVQGAGMANTANAIKTPVILCGDSGKTKLELGDNLTESIEISFTAVNLTANEVTYDTITAFVLTDGYVTKNGSNYISDTVYLKSEFTPSSNTVTVPANSSVTVSAVLKLDKDELDAYAAVFKNGFYIDGFIRMEDSTSGNVSVGIPFMGFFGNWTQAPVFDTTMYDNGGSSLIYEDMGLIGTFLYSHFEEESLILGYDSQSETYNADAIAISPNGDGYSDVLGLYLTPKRSIRNLKITITDENNETLCTMEEAQTLSKFTPYDTYIDIPDTVADGTYLVTIDGLMNYDTDNPAEHSFSMPLEVDRQLPRITAVNMDGATLTLRVCDNAGLASVSIIDATTGEQYDKSYSACVTDDEIIYTFEENQAPDLTGIMVQLTDNAMNYESCFLGGMGGKLGACISDISCDGEDYAVTFNLTGDEEFANASVILAFYDNVGGFVHADKKLCDSLSAGELKFTGVFDLTAADRCKLFIWQDTNVLIPLDAAKTFDIKMYEINGG